MVDVTCIYYTSNAEDPIFEAKVEAALWDTLDGKIPLISVSQKPIRGFGENIVVGEVGVNYWNLYRQMQIACERATTKWIVTAESDCLYPPTGYFDFVPPDERVDHPADFIPNYAYHYRNLVILYKNKDYYWQKHFSLSGLFVDREYLLSRLNRSIGKLTGEQVNLWRTGFQKPRPLFHKFNGWHDFTGEIPIINMKTLKGVKTWTGVTGVHYKTLPYWGSYKAVKARMDI